MGAVRLAEGVLVLTDIQDGDDPDTPDGDEACQTTERSFYPKPLLASWWRAAIERRLR
jgi:hypothetical protein